MSCSLTGTRFCTISRKNSASAAASERVTQPACGRGCRQGKEHTPNASLSARRFLRWPGMAPSRDVILRELPTADVIPPSSGTALCTEATWAVPPAPTLRRLFVCCPDQSSSVLHQAPNPAPSGAESLSLSLSASLARPSYWGHSPHRWWKTRHFS